MFFILYRFCLQYYLFLNRSKFILENALLTILLFYHIVFLHGKLRGGNIRIQIYRSGVRTLNLHCLCLLYNLILLFYSFLLFIIILQFLYQFDFFFNSLKFLVLIGSWHSQFMPKSI